MKVFISWSGNLSKQLAEAIRDWLPGVLQLVNPYFTPSDIEKGTRWSTDIAKELESSQVGIMCITRDNLHADWILFEAGALSKSLDKSHVCPIIFGINNTDLAGPLKQFQTTEFEKSDIHKLISVINGRLGENKLTQKTLDTVFEKWWPDLETKVNSIMSATTQSTQPIRSDRELIEEILALTRSYSKPSNRSPISLRAVQELIESHLEIHDDQVAGFGGYSEVLELLKKAQKPLLHIANRFQGESEDIEEAIARLKMLTYERGSAADEDVPF